MNSYSESLLHYVAIAGNYDVVEYLLSCCSLDPNGVTTNGWTPLLCALSPGVRWSVLMPVERKSEADAMRIARLLLARGADPQPRANLALHFLAAYRNTYENSEMAQLARELISGGGCHVEA